MQNIYLLSRLNGGQMADQVRHDAAGFCEVNLFKNLILGIHKTFCNDGS